MTRYYVDDEVELKKTHPCGNKIWRILTVGIDFLIECQGCGHKTMISRPKFEKAVKQIIKRTMENNNG